MSMTTIWCAFAMATYRPELETFPSPEPMP